MSLQHQTDDGNLPRQNALPPGEAVQIPYWASAALPTPSSDGSAAGLASYLHALRRRLGTAVVLGGLCSIFAAAAVYVMLQPKFTATALLRVASQDKPLVFATADRAAQSEFEVYKNTQRQLVTSRFVLTAALREMSELVSVDEHLDPVTWLQEEIRVDFPGEAEIMRVSMTTGDGERSAQIVNAVVSAYMGEVVDVERRERMESLSSLDQAYKSTESEVRKKQESLKALAERLGTWDKDALSLKQQLALEQFGVFRRQLVELKFELNRKQRDLAIAEAFLDSEEASELTGIATDAMLESDPIAQKLSESLGAARALLADIGHSFVPDIAAGYRERIEGQLDGLREQLENREKEIQGRLRAATEREVLRLKKEIALLEEEVAQLTAEVAEKQTYAEQLGGSSLDVEMMRAEAAHLEGARNRIGDERERLRVELRSRSRVTLVQAAQAPQIADRNARTALMALMSVMAFFVPLAGVSWWESRYQRIASSQEIRVIPGMQLIGSLPLLPSAAMRQGETASGSNSRWQSLLREAVDATSTMLARQACLQNVKTIMISSAVEGEAKTTLATQVACSLARNGYNTILVDANLRSPALHHVLGIVETPGMSEVLRKNVELSEAVQETGVSSLSLLTAGRWDTDQQPLLANGVIGQLFGELRRKYDFVVVDSGPILPIADTRLLSQHVDGVVLSVLRDVSRLPTISASHAILSALGSRVLGVVVTGHVSDLDAGALSARPHRAA